MIWRQENMTIDVSFMLGRMLMGRNSLTMASTSLKKKQQQKKSLYKIAFFFFFFFFCILKLVLIKNLRLYYYGRPHMARYYVYTLQKFLIVRLSVNNSLFRVPLHNCDTLWDIFHENFTWT